MKSRLILAALFAVLCACGSSGDDDGVVMPDDADGDSISDEHEGLAAGTDTDMDGVPDANDEDSDGDGILDYREAGDADPATAPTDSDHDGTPDFRDTDSDNNGRLDGVDGAEDTDGDGKPDFADSDDDGDSIFDTQELGADPANPVDSDNDQIPDFRDTDTDNDTILDVHEGALDYDQDMVGNWRDLDSDGDCRGDQPESGAVAPPRDTDDDGRADFLDRDSDDDGLSDQAEDANCNGARDGSETDAGNADTDGDGASDLVEQTAGTDPNNASQNPQANGDFVFIVPYEEPPSPMEDDLDFATRLQTIDLYVLMDLSGSMLDEINSVRSNLATVISRLTCPPLGTGSPADCIPSIQSGTGSYTYSERDSYVNRLSIQTNPTATANAIPGSDNGDCSVCRETHLLAGWATVTGLGSASSGCTGVAAFNPRPGACANGGTGYPCFRPGALPVILLATDEAPSASHTCPYNGAATGPARFQTLANAANAIGAKFIGIRGATTSIPVTTDLNDIARATGAINAANNQALVFPGADGNAATAIENGIRTLANGVPLDMRADAIDVGGDAVNAVTAFVHHLETLQLNNPMCAGNLTDRDTNGDTFDDEYVDVRAGTPVCWKLIPRRNTTVPATDVPQLYRANVRVRGDNVTTLDTREVFFVVPPRRLDPPIS